MSGLPVPVNLVFTCSQFFDRDVFTLNRSVDAMVEADRGSSDEPPDV